MAIVIWEQKLTVLYRLAAVNFFLGLVGVIQVTRIASHNMSVKNQTPGEALEEVKEGAVDAADGLKADVKEIVKS